MKTILILLLLVGCGGNKDNQINNETNENEKTIPNENQTLAITDESSQPECKAENQNQLIYIISLNQFKVCSNLTWELIDIKGEIGPQGDKGEIGETGSKGDKGDIGSQGNKGDTGENYQDLVNQMLDAVEQYEDSILDIECDSGRGTGVKVSDQRILTAFHVMSDATYCYYYSKEILVGSGGLYFQVSGKDQVFISSINWNSEGINLKEVPYQTNYSVVLGEQLVLVSYPYNLDYNSQYTFGQVTDVLITSSDLEDYSYLWRNSFVSDMVASSGSSGAPIFNQQGIIIAIHVGGYSNTNLDLNYQIPLE